MTKEQSEWLTEGIIYAIIMDDVVETVLGVPIVRVRELRDYLVDYLQEVELDKQDGNNIK